MDERDERLVADDAEFERLFSSLDEVRASDELKSSALAAIFAQMDEDEATAATGDTPLKASSGPQFTLVEGGAGKAASEAQETSEAAREMPDGTQRLRLVSGGKRRAVQKRVPRLRLRVAACLVAVAVGLGGGVAYATPVTHVTATSGETTYDLGVNLFGRTVRAEANSVAGEQLLEGLRLRHARFEDALDRLLEACDEDEGELQVSVEGRGPLGGGASISEKAQAIAEAHKREGTEAKPAPTDAQAAVQDDGAVAHTLEEGEAGPVATPVHEDGADRENLPQDDAKGEAPSGEASEGQIPEGEAPEGETSGGEILEDETPEGDFPAGEVPEGEISGDEAPAGGAPREDHQPTGIGERGDAARP